MLLATSGNFLAAIVAFDCGQDEYHIVIERKLRLAWRWRLDLFEYQDGVLLARTTLARGWRFSPAAALHHGRELLFVHHGLHCPRRQREGISE